MVGNMSIRGAILLEEEYKRLYEEAKRYGNKDRALYYYIKLVEVSAYLGYEIMKDYEKEI